MPEVKDKVVCYVVQDGHLLVFTHLQHPMHITGVQVPAGSIKAGEDPQRAAVRELLEETGLEGVVKRELGTSTYDIRPMRNEVANRFFFELEVTEQDVSRRWISGEDDPESGDQTETWECWWLPVEHAHVLAAGLGAQLWKLKAE
ncbi:NUDIX domain-containing protein [Glutamicibacter sp. AOP38-B1-38]|uniref:NUDIX domain-containing protein n=1 Tax=Glutamicibacter sp. AOP38-B1-38 TaxID=3457680 RepID=UPI004033709A